MGMALNLPRSMQNWRDPSGVEICTARLLYGEVNLTPNRSEHQERYLHRKLVGEVCCRKARTSPSSPHPHGA